MLVMECGKGLVVGGWWWWGDKVPCFRDFGE